MQTHAATAQGGQGIARLSQQTCASIASRIDGHGLIVAEPL